MKILFLSFVLLISATTFSQKLLGYLMADENGVTKDESKAKYLIVEKESNDSAFERLDYNFAGPLIRQATFRNKNLTVLNGIYAEYNSNGYLATYGQYVDDKKDGTWYLYNDTSKAITEVKFHLDTTLSTINLDSLAKAKEKIKIDTTGEIEAVYKGGTKRIREIITSNIKVPDRTESLTKGGTVNVRFIVDINGKPKDIEILHSVEFAFDEEAMRVVALLKNWIPASDKGRKVNAYRIQPITLSF